MPTILINTNFTASTVNESNADQNCTNKENVASVNDDFKQDINSIVTKLLAKSESMDSFLIKYDIDDLLLNNNQTSTSTANKCICTRLTNFFSEVLETNNLKSKCDTTSDISKGPLNAISQNQLSPDNAHKPNELKEIYSELKNIRKYQSDLSDKFNLVINKLNVNNKHINNQHVANHVNNQQNDGHIASQTQLRNIENVSAKINRTQNNPITLTGAKKRKCSAFASKGNQSEEITNINEVFLDDTDRGDTGELEDEQIQSLIGDDSETENLPSETENMPDSEKLIDEFENAQSRDCPSRLSTTTTSSKLSGSKKISHDSNVTNDSNEVNRLELNAQLNDDLGQLNEDYNGQFNGEGAPDLMVKREMDLEIEQRRDIEEEYSYLESDNNENNTFDDYTNEHYSTNPINQSNGKDLAYSGSSNHLNSSYNGQNSQQNKQMLYRLRNNKNSSNTNSFQKQAQPQMAPNQKFRFISQSPTPSPNRFHHQTNCYSTQNQNHNQNHQSQSLSRSFNQVGTTMRQSNNFSPGYSNRSGIKSFTNYSNDQDTKYNKATTKQTSPIAENSSSQAKNDIATEIDINELFKNGGPRFLQMELYKNFKPPIVLNQDKYYIDNSLASSAYSKSKSRRNFAAHLAKLVFTPRERLESNCNGRFGKKALDSTLLMSIRNTLFKFYPCKQSTLVVNGDTITSGDHDENNVWLRDCIPAIDESNRVLKKQLIAWYKKNYLPQVKPDYPNTTVNSIYSNNSPMNTSVSNNSSRAYNYPNMSLPSMATDYVNTGTGVNDEFNDNGLIDEENNMDEEFDI